MYIVNKKQSTNSLNVLCDSKKAANGPSRSSNQAAGLQT